MILKKLLIQFIKRCIYGRQANENLYIEYLKNIGISIGDGLRIFSPETTTIDIQNPHMLRIGDNVRLTKGCTILTHDYSFSVIAGVNGHICSAIEQTTIGNNVFVGMDSIILKGSVIGNNVIIGAKSVVSGHLNDNGVYAGNPAKFIMTIDEFYEKRQKKLKQNAKNFVSLFYAQNGRLPEITEMKEFLPLFDFGGGIPVELNLFIEKTGYGSLVLETYQANEHPYKSAKELLADDSLL